jgi:hypothetical protein
MLAWPTGDGKRDSLKSVEADSKLVWRSSKLTEGRKSKELALSPDSVAAPFRPVKEKRAWLLEGEALSIGAWNEGGILPGWWFPSA